MNRRADSRIARSPRYLHVDFGSCDRLEISETYRSFVDLCAGTLVSRALLRAGDNEPEAHRELREIFSAVARTAALRPDFKLALVPGSPPIEAVYREAQQALRAIGLNTWVFGTAAEAVQWLEGRAPGGPTAS